MLQSWPIDRLGFPASKTLDRNSYEGSLAQLSHQPATTWTPSGVRKRYGSGGVSASSVVELDTLMKTHHGVVLGFCFPCELFGVCPSRRRIRWEASTSLTAQTR